MSAVYTLKVKHNAGFFSCCSMLLEKIIHHFNTLKKLPDAIDNSNLFGHYKNNNTIDTTAYYFDVSDTRIPYTSPVTFAKEFRELQFSDYRNIHFDQVKPFLDKYFTPSPNVLQLVDRVVKQYDIEFDNVCSVYYRATDKSIETNIAPLEEFIEKARDRKSKNPAIRFLFMTDDSSKTAQFKAAFPDTIVVAEVDHPNKFIHSQYLLATVYVISKTKYIICGSGNVSNWIMFYRGNATNVLQYLNPKQFIYNVKNTDYDPNRTVFWL